MKYWAGRKVAVTGAGGFIGSHLVENLAASGAKVRALVHYNSRNDWGCLDQISRDLLDQVEVVLGDVTDAFGMEKFLSGQETVFHLAALIGIPYSYVAPQSYVDVNVYGTLNVLEACRKQGVGRMVHTSTSEVYGTAQYVPIDEKHPLQGQSPYSASKISADKMVESYVNSFEVPVVTVRPFNTYGPRQSARAVIPSIISQALKGKTVRIGNRTPIRDFNFVRDTVEGFMHIAAHEKVVGATLNLCSGGRTTVGDIADKILELTGSKAEIIEEASRIRPEKSEVLRLEGNPALTHTLTGWKSKVSLEEGLKETIRYIEGNLNRYKSAIYNI